MRNGLSLHIVNVDYIRIYAAMKAIIPSLHPEAIERTTIR